MVCHAVTLTGSTSLYSNDSRDVDMYRISKTTQQLLLLLAELGAIAAMSFSMFFCWKCRTGWAWVEKIASADEVPQLAFWK
jgi:hypothetical protein